MMLELTDSEIDSLTTQLYTTSKIDFRNYAKSSLKRRFVRLSELYSLQSTDELYSYISSLTDAGAFVNAITVNTTEMFRDPTFWLELRNNVLPKFINKDQISIWHAGCSTGEEVISMQILLEELGIRHKTKSMACDINSFVLSVAQEASYKYKNFQLSQNNYQKAGGQRSLEDYIVDSSENAFSFNKDLLSNVEYKQFDLVHGECDCKFDLILCRNVLIYFEFGLQERVISKFISQLHPNGHLCIGQQETIINANLLHYLAIANEPEKIYRLF